jgi:hypothetical protein
MAVIRSLTRPAAQHGGSGSANSEKHLTFKVTRVGLRRRHPADTLLCRLRAVVRSKISPPPSADSAGQRCAVKLCGGERRRVQGRQVLFATVGLK